jgi:uncharacterized protein (TIGR03545 family)
MRWKGVIFLIAIVILFLVLSSLITSTIVENELENLGTTIVGARVEIEDLDVSISQLLIKWEKLQITDPDNTMKNMLETGKTEFDLEFVPLLSGKVIIESVMLTGVRSGTDRETDGAIQAGENPQKNSFIASTINNLMQEVSTPVNDQFTSLQQNINVDSIMKILEIESVDKMKNLKEDLSMKYKSWQERLGQISIKEDAQLVKQKITQIDINKAKSIDGFQKTMNELNDIKSKIDGMGNLVSNTKKDLITDLNSSQNNLSQIDDWIKKDYSRALAKAKLIEINAESIGKLIFGKKLIGQLSKYLSYIGTARTYSEKYSQSKPEKENPPRLKGQDIHFSKEGVRPDFWLKKMELSGQSNQNLELGGTLSNLVSNQKLIGQPTEIKIYSKNNKKSSFDLEGIFNYLEDSPGEHFSLSYSGFSLADVKLSESRFLPNEIKNGNGTLSADIKLLSESIDGSIKFSGSNLKFASENKNLPKNEFEKIVHSVTEGINDIDFNARVFGSKDNIKFSLNSNLDQLFASRLKNIAGEKIKAARERIKSEIENTVKSQRAELESFVSKQEDQIRSQVKQYEDMVNNNNKLLDDKKKEAEKIFEKEKSNIKDKVQDLFKF